ncbi:MAG: transglycosylase SLT domain-containing protein [Thermodesulfobacteriota bacterium]
MPAGADIFRHQDEKGVIHFTNVPGNPNYQLYIKEPTKLQPAKAGKGSSRSWSSTHNNLHYLPFLNSHIEEASQQYGVDSKLIQAVIHVESNFDPQALSPKGAQGLMQLMPQTARDMQVSDAFSPKENIHGGARYLRYLLDTFNQDTSLALAAYNAGPEKVNLHRGIPPYTETRTYVQKVLQIYNRLKNSLVSTR